MVASNSGTAATPINKTLRWCMTQFATRVGATCAIRHAEHLIRDLNYASKQPAWVERALALPGSGVETFVDSADDGAKPYYYFGFPIVEHQDYGDVVARFEKDGQLEHAVHWLRRAGVDISMDHVSLFCEQTRLGFVLVDQSIKPYLYRCLHDYYSECDQDDDDDEARLRYDHTGFSSAEEAAYADPFDDEAYDGNGAYEGPMVSINRIMLKAARLKRKVAKLKGKGATSSTNDDQEEPSSSASEPPMPLVYTLSDVFACMDAVLGMACLYAMLGCDTPTSRLIGDAWVVIVASASKVRDDLDDVVHGPAVTEIVKKMTALHVLEDRNHTALTLFNSTSLWNFPYADKPRLESLMVDGLSDGKLCIAVPPNMPLYLLDKRIPRLKHDSPNRWESAGLVSKPIWMSVHTSKIMTDIALSLDGELNRDFCARCEGDEPTTIVGTTSPTSAAAFTIYATWNGQMASVKVNTWLLLSRWPWFRDLLMSGMDEAKSLSVVIPTPLPPQGLFFIASLIYTPDTVEWDHIKRNECWSDAIAACESMGLAVTGLVEYEPSSTYAKRPSKRSSKGMTRHFTSKPPSAKDLLRGSADERRDDYESSSV
jgi:hypothetical protein